MAISGGDLIPCPFYLGVWLEDSVLVDLRPEREYLRENWRSREGDREIKGLLERERRNVRSLCAWSEGAEGF